MSDHKGHVVQWQTWEGMSYRLYCHTCKQYVDLVAQVVHDLMKFIWGEHAG